MAKLQSQEQCGSRSTAANDNDGFLGCDVAPPNREAQRRGHKLVIVFMLLAGVAALVAGLSEGMHEAFATFPIGQAVFQLAAWGRFFAALGHIATIGLLVIGIALVWRWMIRRKRR